MDNTGVREYLKLIKNNLELSYISSFVFKDILSILDESNNSVECYLSITSTISNAMHSVDKETKTYEFLSFLKLFFKILLKNEENNLEVPF